MRRLITGGILTLAVLALSAAIVPLARANRGADARTSSAATEAPILADRAGTPPEGNRGQPQPSAQGGTIPYVGIEIETLSAEAASDLGLDGGVRVRRVVEDGPSAGILEEGDVITVIGEQTVKTAREVIHIVQASEPGDVLTFTVLRDHDTLDLDVTVGEREVQARRHVVRSQIRGHRSIEPFSRLFPSFVRFEVVVETDDGFKTYQGVRGIASDVNVDAGTFTLTPKDGSGPIDYEISSTTKVVIGHEGDLGGLGTEQETLVLSEGDTVLYVLQGQQIAGGSLSGSFFRGPKFGRRPGIQGFPRLNERLRDRLGDSGPRLFERRGFRLRGEQGFPRLSERLRDRLGDFERRGFGVRGFADRLPADIRDLFSDLSFSLDDLDRLRGTVPGPSAQ